MSNPPVPLIRTPYDTLTRGEVMAFREAEAKRLRKLWAEAKKEEKQRRKEQIKDARRQQPVIIG